MDTENPADANRGCLCCIHVLRKQRPALLISNAAGLWQVMCGSDDHDFDSEAANATAKDAIALHFLNVLEDDASLAAIAELPVDWSARREAPDAPWQPYHDPD